MNENNELLEYIYKNSEMGVYTITELLKNLKEKENKIKRVIEKELKEYEDYLKKSKKLLLKDNISLKKNGIMSKMGASMGIKKETKKDNSDAAIAHMLTEGVTMGKVDISTKIKNYEKVVDKKILKLAQDYLKTLDCQIEELKKFL